MFPDGYCEMIREIKENPECDTRRLAFADLIQEFDADWANLIRDQIRYGRKLHRWSGTWERGFISHIYCTELQFLANLEMFRNHPVQRITLMFQQPYWSILLCNYSWILGSNPLSHSLTPQIFEHLKPGIGSSRLYPDIESAFQDLESACFKVLHG